MLKYESNERLLNVLRQIKEGDDISAASIKNRFGVNLSSIKPIDLALSEQELINQGMDFDSLDDKLVLHIKLLVNPLKELYESLPSLHILKKLIAEHRQMDYLLGEIEHLSQRLEQISHITAVSNEFQELVHVAGHVHAASKHADIEEQIIYPSLEWKGIYAITRLLRAQHFEIRHYSVQFHELAFNCAVKEISEIREKYGNITSKMIPLKRRHMTVEENLIYPIAFEVVNSQSWDLLKEKVEEVGFCCF